MLTIAAPFPPPGIDLTGYSFIAVSCCGRLLIFASVWSWELRVYDLGVHAELANDAGEDFPRFTLDDDDHLIDLDMEERHALRFIG